MLFLNLWTRTKNNVKTSKERIKSVAAVDKLNCMKCLLLRAIKVDKRIAGGEKFKYFANRNW